MRFWVILAGLVASTAPAFAQAQCTEPLLAGVQPTVVSSPAGTATLLCYRRYALMHSSDRLTALWSAQHLTSADAIGGDNIGRKDAFHAEGSLPKGGRAELKDYTGFKKIWDRGHMTPADDMPDMDSQRETFSLANMVPQNSDLNQHDWQYLEAALHVLAEQVGELYVVTGPIYVASPPQRLKGKVAVPDYTYKAVYDPTSKRAIAFVATNRPDHVCWVISVAQLTTMSGIDPFPRLSAAVKTTSTPWLLPKGTGGRKLPNCNSPT